MRRQLKLFGEQQQCPDGNMAALIDSFFLSEYTEWGHPVVFIWSEARTLKAGTAGMH